MSLRPPDQDLLDMSSFATLIEKEEQEEYVPLDLYTASLIGDYDAVRNFIAGKHDLNKPNRGGWTALMYAAYVGRDNILNLLLDASARVDIASSKDGMTALMLAAYCASESIMYFLLQRGAMINARDKMGLTSLYHAVKQGHTNAVKLLVSHGADMELSQCATNTTPLMEAAMEGHEVIFRLLLDHGANVEAKSRKGENVRSLAMRYGNVAIVNVIDEVLSKQHEPVRNEPKIVQGSLLHSSSDMGIGDGPEAISKLIGAGGVLQPSQTPSMPDLIGLPSQEAVAALCQDYGKFFINRENPKRESTDVQRHNASQPMIADVPPSRGSNGSSLPEPDKIFDSHFQQQSPPKISRVAMESPKTIFPPQHQAQVRPAVDVPPVPETLRDLLEEFKLENYLEKFESQGIDVTSFLELTDAELKEIGLDKLGPRKKAIIAISKCKERQRFHGGMQSSTDSYQVEQAQVEYQAMAMKLQQAYVYIKQIQTQLFNEQQHHSEVDRFIEAERARMAQLLYCTHDVGKTCKEAVGHLKKMKEHSSKICVFLSKLKENAPFQGLLSELDFDPAIYDSGNTVKCESEIVYNRLDLACKQIERITASFQSKSSWS